MAGDGWDGMSYSTILAKLNGIDPQSASTAQQRWDKVSGAVGQTTLQMAALHQKLQDTTFWSGQSAEAADDAVKASTQRVGGVDYPKNLQGELSKIRHQLSDDCARLTAAKAVAGNNPEPKKDDPDYNGKLSFLRSQAQSQYTDPISAGQRTFDSTYNPAATGPMPTPSGGGASGSSGSGGSSGGAGHSSSTDALSNRSTSPQDLASGDGQQSGQGQGAGQGQGGGSGGGAPSSGSGSGGSGLGSGVGSGSKDSGLPLGSTTAAGYSSTTTGTGAGGGGAGAGSAGSGLGPLRGGAGLPGGTAGGSGSGVNPAAIGGAGMRGGTGPMGMAGASAHGRGKGDGDEDEHAIPDFLINLDNGQQLFYDDRKASPGVIGDWSEQERAEKLRLENEKKRYKSLGWDVKFD